MGTTLATKKDLLLLKPENENRFVQLDQKIETTQLQMTIKLGSVLVAGFVLAIAAIRLWLQE